MHKSATKCNETLGKWCKNKHGASKIIDTLETYQCTNYGLRPKSHLAMQVFVNISSGGWFYSENYARQPTQGISALKAPFLQRSLLLPGTRGNMSYPFTLCRGVSFQKKSKPCCTTGRSFPSTVPWCGAQPLIQAVYRTSPHNACPPNSRKQVEPLIFISNNEVPRRPLRTIIDTSSRGH
jgi:hypothetical protein